MKKLKLLMLDANIVIMLHELGLWEKVIAVCDVHIAGTIVDDEADFYFDDQHNRRRIDLSNDICGGSITRFDVPLSQVSTFKAEFGPQYFAKLDPGEVESLAHLMCSTKAFTVCSADKIVFRVLGARHLTDRGISLEEILSQIGLARVLKHQYTKGFREHWSGEGFREGLQGTA
ncbi:MAG: hypothetical protein M1305_01850 [Candidatus Marsarchaeota archaeon]|nr:hypothetical protein [Candidatus Marsarchaeota archaeon]